MIDKSLFWLGMQVNDLYLVYLLIASFACFTLALLIEEYSFLYKRKYLYYFLIFAAINLLPYTSKSFRWGKTITEVKQKEIPQFLSKKEQLEIFQNFNNK